MVREIRFRAQDFNTESQSTDCYLDPQDPVFHEGLPAPRGQIQAMAQCHMEQRKRASALGIRPGTPAWFALTQTNRK